jgi:AraC-like DNA-binding protein
MMQLELQKILILLERAYEKKQTKAEPSLDPKAVQAVEKIQKHLLTHFTENLSPEKISQLVHYSWDHLARLFKKRTGYQIREFLAEVRIREAAKALRQSDAAIIDIAFHCGFNNLSYFNRLFKQLYGTTPVHFRHQNSLAP